MHYCTWAAKKPIAGCNLATFFSFFGCNLNTFLRPKIQPGRKLPNPLVTTPNILRYFSICKLFSNTRFFVHVFSNIENFSTVPTIYNNFSTYNIFFSVKFFILLFRLQIFSAIKFLFNFFTPKIFYSIPDFNILCQHLTLHTIFLT